MKRTTAGIASIALGLGAVATVAAAKPAAPTKPASAAASRASGAIVIAWNQELLRILRTPGAQPPSLHATRSFAIMHAAIYDAVVAITHDAAPYLVSVKAGADARADVAAAQAGHDTLAALYPGFISALDQQLASELATIPGGLGKQRGQDVGHLIAARILALRANDGSGNPAPVLSPGTEPGAFRPSPPMLASPVFTGWGKVTPFVLETGHRFRPEAPPALTSASYAAAINEVQNLGRNNSAIRTPDQTTQAKFWAAPIWNYWNEIAQNAALNHHSNLVTTARLFLELNLSFADGAIAFYDAKYTFSLWRPVTAIRLADTDGNPATTADPTWTPLANTPADPSYPGAHSVISAAGAAVLTAFYGDHNGVMVTSVVLPGVVRTFDSYHDVSIEAGLSRIFAGVHTRLDHVAGLRLGRQVAAFVLEHATSDDGVSSGTAPQPRDDAR